MKKHKLQCKFIRKLNNDTDENGGVFGAGMGFYFITDSPFDYAKALVEVIKEME